MTVPLITRRKQTREVLEVIRRMTPVTRESIANAMGVPPQNVARAIAALMDGGYIVPVRPPGRRPWLYRYVREIEQAPNPPGPHPFRSKIPPGARRAPPPPADEALTMKERQRIKIERDMAAYLRAGGRVTRLPSSEAPRHKARLHHEV